MKFSTATLAATTLALASAAPAATSPAESQPTSTPAVNPGETFTVKAVRPDSDINDSKFQAITRGLRVNNPAQNASCGADSINYATFQITETGDLYLFTANTTQQFYVDRSGMGRGIIQYTTGVQNIGRNQERGPFAIKGDELVFSDGRNPDTSFQACPNALGGGDSVWLQGATNPGGNEGCVDFVGKVEKVEDAVKCLYTN